MKQTIISFVAVLCFIVSVSSNGEILYWDMSPDADGAILLYRQIIPGSSSSGAGFYNPEVSIDVNKNQSWNVAPIIEDARDNDGAVRFWVRCYFFLQGEMFYTQDSDELIVIP